jgi:hypothetical protein
MLVTNIIQQTVIFFAYIYSLYSKDMKFSLEFQLQLAYQASFVY